MGKKHNDEEPVIKGSVYWLENEIKIHLKEIILNANYEKMESLFETAKEKHRDEIMDARTNGMWYVKEKWGEVRTNKKYYNETFNTKQKKDNG